MTNRTNICRASFAPWLAILGAVALAIALFGPQKLRAEWVVDGNTVYFTDHVGYTADGSAFSGTVALRMDTVTASGTTKIVTTILSVTPEPGFAYAIKKSGGVNGTVEIEFASANCQSKFSFLYKPGLTKIDFGVMRCR